MYSIVCQYVTKISVYNSQELCNNGSIEKDKIMKYTREHAEQGEMDMLVEALGCEIELSDEFLQRYCSKAIRELLFPIPERERGFILSCCDHKAWFNGSPASQEDGIWLNISEIEVQFKGDPEEYFEDPSDWHIQGDLAYLYVGYGLSIDYNLEQLEEAIAEYC